MVCPGITIEIKLLDHQLQVCGRDIGSGASEGVVEHEPAAKATRALDEWIEATLLP